jgi:hypothetical protein
MSSENFSSIPPPPPPEIAGSSVEIGALRIVVGYLVVHSATVTGGPEKVKREVDNIAEFCRDLVKTMIVRQDEPDEEMVDRFRRRVLQEVDAFFSGIHFARPQS